MSTHIEATEKGCTFGQVHLLWLYLADNSNRESFSLHFLSHIYLPFYPLAFAY